jgi:hypothetical protein
MGIPDGEAIDRIDKIKRKQQADKIEVFLFHPVQLVYFFSGADSLFAASKISCVFSNTCSRARRSSPS